MCVCSIFVLAGSNLLVFAFNMKKVHKSKICCHKTYSAQIYLWFAFFFCGVVCSIYTTLEMKLSLLKQSLIKRRWDLKKRKEKGQKQNEYFQVGLIFADLNTLSFGFAMCRFKACIPSEACIAFIPRLSVFVTFIKRLVKKRKTQWFYSRISRKRAAGWLRCCPSPLTALVAWMPVIICLIWYEEEWTKQCWLMLIWMDGGIAGPPSPHHTIPTTPTPVSPALTTTCWNIITHWRPPIS